MLHKRFFLPGPAGEAFAAKYLRKHGYLVIEKNWRHATGEIDLIALKERRLVFIEVKARHERVQPHFGALEAVDEKKKRTIHELIRQFCFSERLKLRKFRYISCRLDIIGITFYRGLFGVVKFKDVQHVEDAS